MRVRPLIAAAVVAVVVLLTPARAGDRALARSGRLRGAIDRAVGYLVNRQQEGVGAYGSKDRLALTSMATLALMSTGSTPRRGPYAERILRALRWVLSKQRPRGHFWDEKSGYSQIHNHGYALLLLTQAHGECGKELDERIAGAIRRGIIASLESQHDNGGFGYFLYRRPPPGNTMFTGDEASTTISQIQALRGARNAGFRIPKLMLRRAETYIHRSQHKSGGFIYSLRSGRVSFKDGSNEPTFAITAASTCVLNSLGTYRGKNLERAIRYLEKWLPPTEQDVHFYYYGHFYASQVMHQIGGSRDRRWRRAVLADLIARQEPDGRFARRGDSHVAGEDGAILNTAWALQVLTIDRGVLPIHER